MWALLNSDNTINKILTRPKQLTIGDVNYPSNIFSVWTSAELEVLKIYEVVMDNTNFKDTRYYINTNQSFNFQSSVTINSIDYTNVVVASYSTATARVLDNVLYTAEDETANSIHVEGTVKDYGITTQLKEKANIEAAGCLASTDWMIIRAAEGGTAVPSATTTWRAAVRTKANAMCTAIDGAANVDALAALYVYNSASPPVRPLGDFPILGS